MARLIDADRLIEEELWDADTRIGYVQVVDVGSIEEAPTVEDVVPMEQYKELLSFANEMAAFFPACVQCDGKTILGERTDECIYTKQSVTEQDTIYCMKRGIKNIQNILKENEMLRKDTSGARMDGE